MDPMPTSPAEPTDPSHPPFLEPRRAPARPDRRRNAVFAFAVIAALHVALLASCGSPSNLVILDPAFPVIDPEAAKAYGSFRFGGGRKGLVLEYPASGGLEFLTECSRKYSPRAVLLSPLLASAYPDIRNAFPDAWLLGMGLPDDPKAIRAVWDPLPAARRAGARAGVFLGGGGAAAPEAEAVFVSVEASGDGRRPKEGFWEGLRSTAPDVRRRNLTLPAKPADTDIDGIVRELSGPATWAVFLDAGASGLKIARALEASGAWQRPEGNRKALIILRLPNRATPEIPQADIVISGDFRPFLTALGRALREGKPALVEVPEALSE